MAVASERRDRAAAEAEGGEEEEEAAAADGSGPGPIARAMVELQDKFNRQPSPPRPNQQRLPSPEQAGAGVEEWGGGGSEELSSQLESMAALVEGIRTGAGARQEPQSERGGATDGGGGRGEGGRESGAAHRIAFLEGLLRHKDSLIGRLQVLPPSLPLPSSSPSSIASPQQ